MMKILRVSSDLYPYTIGGLGVHVHELSKSIANKGHQMTVYASANNIHTQQGVTDNYEFYNFQPLLKISGNSIAPSMLTTLLKKAKEFDLIHAHSHLFFSTNLTVFIKRLTKIPLIVTNHGLISQTVPMNLQRIYLPTVAKWTLQYSDAVICYTPEMVKEMGDWGIPTKNVRVIHNGVNVEVFKPLKKNKRDYDIIWVGRYVPGKGVGYLLEIVRELRKDFKDLKVLMIGNGPLKESIEKKAKEMDLMNNIKFLEKISNDELPSYYNNCKLFVLTSLEEGVPRTILEAMACGTPIVCTNLPQLQKLIDGCGILVEKKNILGFVDAISTIFQDQRLSEEFAQNGRRKIKENYSWDDTVTQTLSLYKEMIC